jgi:hypothetical protein
MYSVDKFSHFLVKYHEIEFYFRIVNKLTNLNFTVFISSVNVELNIEFSVHDDLKRFIFNVCQSNSTLVQVFPEEGEDEVESFLDVAFHLGLRLKKRRN